MAILDTLKARARAVAASLPAEAPVNARPRAREQPERSLEDWRRLAARSPNDPRLLVNLAFALDAAAASATDDGDLSGALPLRTEALEARRKLAQLAPDDPNSVRFQWSGLSELAQLQRKIGHEAIAAALFEEGLALMTGLVSAHPAEPRLRQDHLAALIAVADTHVRAGDRAAARTKFDMAVAEGRDCLARDLDSDAVRRMLATALEKSGADRANLGEHDAAIVELRDALTVREARASANPGKPALSFECANTISLLVWALSLAGKPAAALEESRDALVRFTAVAAVDRSRAVIEQLVALLSRRAELWETLGKPEEAEAAHDESLRWARAGLQDEDDWDGLRLLRERLDAKEAFFYRMGRHKEGLVPRHESLALLQRAFRAAPSLETLQDALERAMTQLMGHEDFVGHAAEALQAGEARLFLAGLAATRRPNHSTVISELADSYWSVARWRAPGAKRLAQRECRRLLTRLADAGMATAGQKQALKELEQALAQATDGIEESDPIAYCAPWDTPSGFKDDVKAECFVCARPVRQRPHLLPVRKLCLPCFDEQMRLQAEQPRAAAQAASVNGPQSPARDASATTN